WVPTTMSAAEPQGASTDSAPETPQMLNRFARALFTRIFTPTAAFLVRLGISPDVVTLIGTLGVVTGALAFYPRGEFFWGTVVITAFVFSDLIDGTMARMTGGSSRWGPWLHPTLDP